MDSESTREQHARRDNEVLRVLVNKGAPQIVVFDEIFLAFGDHDVSEWKPRLLKVIDQAIETAANPDAA